MHRLLSLILVLSTLLVPGAVPGQPKGDYRKYQDVFLWRIEGEKPSYLFGTLHLRNEHILAIPPMVREALESADAIYGEVALAERDREENFAWHTLPEGKTFQGLIGEEAHARFAVLAARKYVHLNYYDDKHPFYAMYHLYRIDELSRRVIGFPTLDQKLAEEAIALGKEEGGLEVGEEQVKIFTDWSDEELRKLFVLFLSYDEMLVAQKRKAMAEHMEIYFSGDMDRFEGAFREIQELDRDLYDRWNKRVLVERDEKMADRIEAKLKEDPGKSYFFAIGAAHFMSGSGIQHRLEKKGLKITRMSLKDVAAAEEVDGMESAGR